MAVPSSLLRVPVDMPNRSGHNMSHSNTFSGTTGTLIPVMCKELLPNDTVSLGSQFQVQFPPMVTDFYGKVDFVLEAFFCPARLCWGGFQDFMTHDTAAPQYPEGTLAAGKPKYVPQFDVSKTGVSSGQVPIFEITSDSLLHYLDYGKAIYGTSSKKPSALPALAYHRIWDDWYRDSRIQAPLFYKPPRSSNASVSYIPYLSTDSNNTDSVIVISLPNQTQSSTPGASSFSDNIPIHALRQRNWVKDYFTSASTLPQAGNPSEVKFDVTSDVGSFSISTLRQANSLQRWMERNNLAGYRYSDQIYAQYGIYPSDAIMDRPLYLGRTVHTVYNRSVFSTVDASADTGGVLATKGASSQVLGEGSLVDNFTASEHGYLMVLASLVPRPVYGSGVDRSTMRTSVGDFAFPLLAGMGDQAIYVSELTGNWQNFETFGYTDLYADYKFANDKIHGLLRDGFDLEKYALQRSFDPFEESSLVISSSFLQIPKEYLDQVQAVDTSTAGYSYWAEIHFPFKKLSTIPAYSEPTLADLKHAHKEYISRGGKRL